MARTALPTLIAMQSFEAAARHLSFTRASEELNLTQSAVSKQVAQLEVILERSLFRRVRKRLQITPEGAFYLREVRKILVRTEMSTRYMRSYRDEVEVLNVATPPTFGDRWLIQNLNGFRFRHPRINLNICNRVEPFDLTTEQIDVAFFFGHGVWPNAKCIKLIDEAVVPVCSPNVLSEGQITEPLELTQFVLLQTATRPEAWHDWFKAQNCYTSHSYHGPCFETFSMALRAARTGCGVALVPSFLAREELNSGQLIIPWPFSQNSTDAHYIAYAEHKGEIPKIKALVTWVLEHLTDTASIEGTACDLPENMEY